MLYKKLIRIFSDILNSVKRDHIGAFSAQASFFLMMSFFPLIFIIHSLLKIGNASVAGDIWAALFGIIPAAWSAGKSFYALSEGFSFIAKISLEKNYFLKRLRSLIYSILFSSALAFMFFIGVHGNSLDRAFSFIPGFSLFGTLAKRISVPFVIFTVTSLLYNFLPDWSLYTMKHKLKINRKIILFCASASSLIIYIHTLIFSEFSFLYAGNTNIYYSGTGAFISLMIWLYISMYILMLGFKLICLVQKRSCINPN